jgi:hypothetical protein
MKLISKPLTAALAIAAAAFMLAPMAQACTSRTVERSTRPRRQRWACGAAEC